MAYIIDGAFNIPHDLITIKDLLKKFNLELLLPKKILELEVPNDFTSYQYIKCLDDLPEDEQEDYTIEWVIPNAQKNEMEPILLTLHPHKKSHELTAHHGEEFGYVLKGNVTLVRENKRYKLKAQETFYLDGTKSHYLYNHGNSDAKVLWITTPPMF